MTADVRVSLTIRPQETMTITRRFMTSDDKSVSASVQVSADD